MIVLILIRKEGTVGVHLNVFILLWSLATSPRSLGVVTLAAVIRVPIWCFVPIISLSCPQLYLFNLRVWPMWIRDWFCYPSTNLDPSLFIEYSDRRYAHIQPEISSQPTHVYSPTTNKYSRYILNWTLTWIWWLFDNFRNQNLNINVNVRKI